MEAISWLLVSTGPTFDINGIEVPEGTAVTREMWDGEADWTLPDNTRIEPDDGRLIWQPEVIGVVCTLPIQDWLGQLPADVLQAVMAASHTDGHLMMALTLLAARGSVDLSDPTGLLRNLLSHAMRATVLSSNPLTSALADTLLPL
jgi:hypothetical protein